MSARRNSLNVPPWATHCCSLARTSILGVGFLPKKAGLWPYCAHAVPPNEKRDQKGLRSAKGADLSSVWWFAWDGLRKRTGRQGCRPDRNRAKAQWIFCVVTARLEVVP